MGSHMSKTIPKTSSADDFTATKLHIQKELRSYEAICKLGTDLHAFDTSPETRTNQVINKHSSGGLEVRALSFESLKQNIENLLEMNEEVVKVTLEHKKDIWKCQELFELVEEYLENSLQTLDFCTALEKCLKRARANQLLVAIQRFEEESESGDKHHARTLQELKNFKSAGDPFTEELFQNFQSVYKHQILMLEKLQRRTNKLDKKLKFIHSRRRVSSVIFLTALAAVWIGSVVAAAIAAPPVAAALGAAATAIPINSMGKWIDSRWGKYKTGVKAQKEAIGSMEAVTCVAINDLDKINDLIDPLEVEIESLLHNVDNEIEEEAVKISMKEIKKKVGEFMKNAEDLGVQTDVCSKEIKRARTVVLQRVIKQPII